jgi:PAS domain-containing protein
VTFSRDVTEAEQPTQSLRESRARLNALVASLHAGAMVEDAQGTVILANELLLAGFGAAKDLLQQCPAPAHRPMLASRVPPVLIRQV